MGKLGDIMGDDFENKYQKKSQERREEARKVSKETLMEIAYKAIHGGGFDGEEPRFRFDGENVDHDVLLMSSPEENLSKFQWPLGDDAKTQGMFHLDQLFSCAFQENMLHLLERIKTDEYYLVVGRYQEKTQTDSDGTEDVYYNINPVRGIVPLEVAKKYADEYESKMEGSSVEEQAKQQKEEMEGSDDSEDDTDLSGLDGGGSEVSDDDIVSVFKAVGDQSPKVLEKVANGDSDTMDKLVEVTNNNLDGEASRERILDVFEDNVEEIDGRGEDEEDGDGDMDLGGLGDDDDSGSEDGSDDSEEEAETSDDSGSSDGDGSEDPSDWF